MESLVATLRREIEVVIAAQEFGYVNDVRMAPKLVEVQKQSNGGIDAARAASYAVGHHEAQAAHLWRNAGEAWDGLKHTRRFWD
jgi:hypothetical protein